MFFFIRQQFIVTCEKRLRFSLTCEKACVVDDASGQAFPRIHGRKPDGPTVVPTIAYVAFEFEFELRLSVFVCLFELELFFPFFLLGYPSTCAGCVCACRPKCVQTWLCFRASCLAIQALRMCFELGCAYECGCTCVPD